MQTKNKAAIIQAKCDEVFLIAQISHSSLRTQANISFWKLSAVTFEMSLMGYGFKQLQALFYTSTHLTSIKIEHKCCNFLRGVNFTLIWSQRRLWESSWGIVICASASQTLDTIRATHLFSFFFFNASDFQGKRRNVTEIGEIISPQHSCSFATYLKALIR